MRDNDNPKTARSQMIGGIVWGWGKATMEQSVQEPIHGHWLAKNLSSVSIPVNADIPSDIQIHFVDEFDPHASAIGARGIGELGAPGVDAAVACCVRCGGRTGARTADHAGAVAAGDGEAGIFAFAQRPCAAGVNLANAA